MKLIPKNNNNVSDKDIHYFNESDVEVVKLVKTGKKYMVHILVPIPDFVPYEVSTSPEGYYSAIKLLNENGYDITSK